MNFLEHQKKKKETLIAYREVFATEAGKKVLHDLIRSCNMLNTTMDANPHEMAYNEGARSVVLRILSTLKVDPIAFEKMLEGQPQE